MRACFLWRRIAQLWMPPTAAQAVRVVRDPEVDTRPIRKRLLIVVRTHTSLNRVVDLLYTLGGDVCFAIKFVIDVGSKFARELADRLLAHGAQEITWAEAKGLTWDAILAAHVDSQLAELADAGPLFVIAHGAGYSRRRFASTQDSGYSAGLSPYELIHEDKVIPRLIGLSHEEQLDRICPSVRDRAIVIGDPVRDKLAANMRLKQRFSASLGADGRRVVVVSTTWGARSLLRQWPALVEQLVAQLPVDDYLVVVLMHPNVWFGESRLELEVQFASGVDGGALLVNYHTWEAALIAADVVVGDIGSVTTYAAGLDIPVVIAACGEDELDVASPASDLHAALPRLIPSVGLREQVEQVMSDHRAGRWGHITDRIFGLQGESLKAIVTALYSLMGLRESEVRVRTKPFTPPAFLKGDRITAYRVTAEICVDDKTGRCRVERYPDVVTSPEDMPNSVLVIDSGEVDPNTRGNAEIIVHSEQLSAEKAEVWLAEVQVDCPGAALAATVTATGVLLRFHTGLSIEVSADDPFAVAAALHRWHVEGRSITTGLTLELSMGKTTAEMVVTRLPD